MDYAFHHTDGATVGALIMHLCLPSDVKASVQAFDLLRAHPEYQAVVVICEGRQILVRRRNGGKSEIAWAWGCPRLRALDVRPARKRQARA
jgi:hypothetical protein